MILDGLLCRYRYEDDGGEKVEERSVNIHFLRILYSVGYNSWVGYFPVGNVGLEPPHSYKCFSCCLHFTALNFTSRKKSLSFVKRMLTCPPVSRALNSISVVLF